MGKKSTQKLFLGLLFLKRKSGPFFDKNEKGGGGELYGGDWELFFGVKGLVFFRRQIFFPKGAKQTRGFFKFFFPEYNIKICFPGGGGGPLIFLGFPFWPMRGGGELSLGQKEGFIRGGQLYFKKKI